MPAVEVVFDGIVVIVVLPVIVVLSVVVDIDVLVTVEILDELVGWADVGDVVPLVVAGLAVVELDVGTVGVVEEFPISCPRIKASFETHLLV